MGGGGSEREVHKRRRKRRETKRMEEDTHEEERRKTTATDWMTKARQEKTDRAEREMETKWKGKKHVMKAVMREEDK